MNYYQLTSGLESDSDEEVGWMVTGVRTSPDVKKEHIDGNQKSMHLAMQGCLNQSTLQDFAREYNKNTQATGDKQEERKHVENVVLRRK